MSEKGEISAAKGGDEEATELLKQVSGVIEASNPEDDGEADQLRRGTRERQQTEKGRSYQILCMCSALKTFASRLKGHGRKIDALLSESISDLVILRTNRDKFLFDIERFSRLIDDYVEYSGEEVDSSFETRCSAVLEQCDGILKRLNEEIRQLTLEERSNRSHTSKVSVKKVKAQVQEALENIHNVSQELENLENDVQDNQEETGLPKDEHSKDELVNAFLQSAPTPKGGSDVSTTLLSMLCNQLSMARLPVPEPSIFSGDPLSFPNWKKSFETLICSRGVPPDERLHFLARYLAGDAKACIEGFFLIGTADAYLEAFKLLEDRYGNSFVIGNAFRDKLESWPKIQSRDCVGLRKFVDFLRQCEIGKKSIRSLRFLDDDRENRKLLLKLPDWLVQRWRRVVVEYKKRNDDFPPFTQFVKFLSNESEIANEPSTLMVATKSSDKPAEKKATSHSVSVKKPAGENKKKEKKCAICKGNHFSTSCKSFADKSEQDKKDFVFKEKLCFVCLNPGHRSVDCKLDKKCDKCEFKHASVLHGIKFRKTGSSKAVKGSSENVGTSVLRPEVQSFLPSQSVVNNHVQVRSSATCDTKVGVGKMCSMIVPVYVSANTSPSKERLVYALLDTQSDTSFILGSTCTAIGAVGEPVQLSLSTMFAENKMVDSKKVTGLRVRGFDSQEFVDIPMAYTRDIMPANRSHIPSSEMIQPWPYLHEVGAQLMPVSDCEIGLLIGYNCSKAIEPVSIIPSDGKGPYAHRSRLGWSIVGIIDHNSQNQDLIGYSHRVVTYATPVVEKVVQISLKSRTSEVSPRDVLGVLESDFRDIQDGVGLSKEDKQFLDIMDTNIHQDDEGFYEMPLPFREGKPSLVDNVSQARNRLSHLKSKLDKDDVYKSEYVKFMSEMFRNGYAEEVPEDELQCGENVWYIPHHGVYNSSKSKLRVVFDCSARYLGKSLNDCLLQGPDLTNTLTGVLHRFREENVAFSCDVTKMFYQFRVPKSQRNFLRFLWWENGDTSLVPKVFRMTVHIFGATSSPSCSNFGLRKLASDYEGTFGTDVGDFLRHNFYVDDGLKSVPDENTAIDLIQRTVALCKKGHLHLHKFISNSRVVLESIPPEDRTDGVQNVDLRFENLPVERALGIEWSVESDTFRFRVVLKNRPFTRRGLLATVASIYDPLGFIAPFTLIGKRILQRLCISGLDWDDPIPEEVCSKWEQWLTDLKNLEKIDVNRCVKPPGFVVERAEFHHFCDASLLGYGVCSYIRLVSTNGEVHVSLVMGKSRVTPIKPITVPRLELTAAVLAVKVAQSLGSDFTYDATHTFWSDSKVVLGYIANESRRFHIFVANRVGFIHSNSDVAQWKYIPGSRNIADLASRGGFVADLLSSCWFKGPRFLWQELLPTFDKVSTDIPEGDPELKKIQLLSTHVDEIDSEFDLSCFENVSSWYRLKKVVALCLLFGRELKARARGSTLKTKRSLSLYDCLDSIHLKEAESKIISLVQSKSFADELRVLKEGNSVTRRSVLYKLDPFIDGSGIVRVGGRLRLSDLSYATKHPVVLPSKSHVTRLIVAHCHERVHHQGKGMTLNECRSSGYWIIGGQSIVSRHIFQCVFCRRVHAAPQTQKMADLPDDRLAQSPPFTYVAVDYFGPFEVREGRKELKRWGVLFTCLSSRAVHLEVANSLSTSSFLNALRRFISVRGPISLLRSDQGTNFVGAKAELRNAIKEIDNAKVREFLMKNDCIFEFKFNPPSASHMGGAWERMIRSVRRVLNSILAQNGCQLDDESLRTFMCEVSAVINCRPLTAQYMSDPDFPEPLTPNHLLTGKSKVVVSPPGEFKREDIYSIKRWRRVQYLVDQFWIRWCREYVHNLQSRSKWVNTRRNVQVGDVVLIQDENVCRNLWKLGRVVSLNPSVDGLVRSVTLAVGDRELNKKGKRSKPLSILERPIQKLVVLAEANTQF